MRSIRVRLKVLFVLIVTLVLAVFGFFSQANLAAELAQRSAQLQQGVLTRLQISLPTPMWDLEANAVAEILTAELLPREVRAIRVYDSAGGLFVARQRRPDGGVIELGPAAAELGDGTSLPLTFHLVNGNKHLPVGRAVVHFSDEGAAEVLAEQWKRKAAEILVLDLILILALSLSLQMVFVPLQRLCNALLELARRESDLVEELPEQAQGSEFGDVAAAFNRIMRKLKSIIERAHSAEAAALHSERLTAEAYQELRQAQESLVQAERLASLGGLVAGIAHEINTPVGIALTSASVLQEATVEIKIAMGVGNVKKSDMLDYLETAAESTHLIMVNADRAAHLIQSFKQIAADQTSEARRRFEVHDYLDEIILSLRPRIKQTRVSVECDCPKFVSVDGYPGAFAQIITNLTTNALQHGFDGDTPGRIRIEVTQEEGDMLRIVFRDNGKGIPPHLIDKIFDPFFTTRRGQGGTGLGLNIVFNLVVKTFGGTVQASSHPGNGACFTILIPRIAP